MPVLEQLGHKIFLVSLTFLLGTFLFSYFTKLKCSSIHGNLFTFNATGVSGKIVSLKKYQDLVTIIVNVASDWQYTDLNYKQFDYLLNKYYHLGLRVLAFPCNQFGRQETGEIDTIFAFIKQKAPMIELFDKCQVVGENQMPLFNFLSHHPNTCSLLYSWPNWNFVKYLVDKKGVPFKRYHCSTPPVDLEPDISKLL